MRTAPLVAVLLLTSLVPASAPAAAQDTVTATVTVVDQDGQPVGGATVTATWDDGQTTVRTASNGKAFVDVPRGARVELDARSDRHVRNFPYVIENVEGGEEVTVDVAERGFATVTVRDANGPLANTQVIVREDGRDVVSGRTNDDGTYDTPALERGTYTLVTFKRGYHANQTTLTINANVTETVEMRRGSVTVTFRLVDDHFEPPRSLDNVTVTVGDIGTARTTSGRATMTVPVNSRITVSATKPAYRTVDRTLVVGESPEDVTLSVRREPTLDVRTANARVVAGQTVLASVVDAYGAPVANATISVDGTAVGETDASGELRVPIESAGDHEVVATKGGVTSEAVVVEGVSGGGQSATPVVDGTPSPADDTSVALPGFTLLTGVAGVLAAAGIAALRRR